MSRGNRSTRAGSDPVPQFSRQRTDRAGWDYRYTLERIRATQADPFIKLIPPELNRYRLAAPRRQAEPKASAPEPSFLVDQRTGEIVRSTYPGEEFAPGVVDRHCRQKKQDRRHFVIVSGHGGRNGVRNYKPRSECK